MQRLYHLKATEECLKWARGLAKCTLPIAGPIWALCSEIGGEGSIQLCNCDDDDHHVTPEEMLEKHIQNLQKNQ